MTGSTELFKGSIDYHTVNPNKALCYSSAKEIMFYCCLVLSKILDNAKGYMNGFWRIFWRAQEGSGWMLDSFPDSLWIWSIQQDYLPLADNVGLIQTNYLLKG